MLGGNLNLARLNAKPYLWVIQSHTNILINTCVYKTDRYSKQRITLYNLMLFRKLNNAVKSSDEIWKITISVIATGTNLRLSMFFARHSNQRTFLIFVSLSR